MSTKNVAKVLLKLRRTKDAYPLNYTFLMTKTTICNKRLHLDFYTLQLIYRL